MTACEIGIASCSVCEQPTELIEAVGGAMSCPACAPILRRALAEGGSILRWRCARLDGDAPLVCGRVWKVAYVRWRHGEIVSDTSGACPKCRPAQRAFVERLAGHKIEWEEEAHV